MDYVTKMNITNDSDDDEIFDNLINIKNDELKNICKNLDMQKTVYNNKSEYIGAIKQFISTKNKEELVKLCNKMNVLIKSSDNKTMIINKVLYNNN